MSFAAVVSGGVALAGMAIQADAGAKQMADAKAMSVVDPGYQGNPALARRAEVLGNRAVNYTLPGSSQALRDIDRAAESAFQAGVQGATSSNDVLDLAARMAYTTQSSRNRLAAQQAQGEEQALLQYLDAEAQAGQEVANANQWDRQEYQYDRQAQANLDNAGRINLNNAIQSGLSTVGQIATAKLAGVGNKRKLTPEEYAAQYNLTNG